ncbi:sulfotransferase family 2 domain-containing protein [Jatrophihabitans endophyticus]|uniref:sulfotransferase family 2 domain-containing protein n=1 Tax=Jatrophihabitans endophyticus TaxID=1206085 RepID=UPI0019DE8F5B|nr:sulfotransferase family 2 domain-containing protein [Jatrophihabitans endophyticus]MBE7186961.1 sulfotransferase family 2 domain-containing protein [Jatrophihabitans endophyticus]
MSNSPATTANPLVELSKRKGTAWRTFILPQVRVAFIQVNKNACTSLKWMIAGIAGEDLDAFGPSLEATVNGEDDIHDRSQWKHAPKLADLDPEVLAGVRPDNGWFVFGVTRDPRSRLFSAWQSKLLLDNPGYASRRGAPWYPRHPASAESVAEDFDRFITYLEQDPTPPIRFDGHFRDQVDSLSEDLVDYTEIYDIRDLARLKTDLRAHLDTVGFTGELWLPRTNDTPLRANALPFANGVRERVERLYARDFERFGDRWDFATIEKAPAWTDEQLAEVDAIAENGRRLGHLLGEARRFRTALKEQQKLTAAERQRADDLERRLAEATRVAPPAAVQPLHIRLRRRAGAIRRSLRG